MQISTQPIGISLIPPWRGKVRAGTLQSKGGTSWSEAVGPGVITGAADDDPSGITTYSQAGAVFGYSMLWTAFFTFPLMAVIQEISARIGRVTGRGIAGNIRRHYSQTLLYAVVVLLLVANTLNIAADLAAMGAAVRLLLPVPTLFVVIGAAALCVLLEVFLPYRRYVPILRWLVLALLAYIVTAFIVDVPWGEALRATLVPHIAFTGEYLGMLIAVIGTTISPYLFFWQSSQEVEEMHRVKGERPLLRTPREAPRALHRLRVDTLVGMAISNAVTFFIILTTAATLHAHDVVAIQTAADAASALTPLAGRFASALFALGIVGTGLLAIPVLAGSAAYGLGEALRMPVGLERKASKAKGFYGVIAGATLVGCLLNFLGIDPIAALIGVAILNGIISVPLMAVLVHMSGNEHVMGKLTMPRSLRMLGWLTTLLVGAAVVGFFITL